MIYIYMYDIYIYKHQYQNLFQKICQMECQNVYVGIYVSQIECQNGCQKVDMSLRMSDSCQIECQNMYQIILSEYTIEGMPGRVPGGISGYMSEQM